MRVCGAHKVWCLLNGKGVDGRCIVEGVMRRQGLQGVRGGKGGAHQLL